MNSRKHACIGLGIASLAGSLWLAACSSKVGDGSAGERNVAGGIVGTGGTAGTREANAQGAAGPERMVLRLIHDQDLTSSQELQLLSVRKGVLTKWQGLHQDLAPIAAALRAELAKSAPDTETVHALTEEGLGLHRALAHDVTDEALSLLATLSDEQRALLVARARQGGVGVPTRADIAAITHAAAAQSSGPSLLTPRSPPAASSWKPNELAFRVVEGAALSDAQKDLRREAKRQLRDDKAGVDAAVAAETDTLLVELAKPAPDVTAVHAAVDRVLAVYATGAHATAHGALAVSLSLTHDQKLALAR